jgi:membrane-associated phospholipid phosphatase
VRYVAAGCAIGLAALGVAVAIDAGPLPGERRVLTELRSATGDSYDPALTRFADLTDLLPLAIVGLAVGLGLAGLRRWRDLAYGAAVVVVVWAVNPVLKELVARPRPELWPAPMDVSEYSFPSGHAADTAVLVGAIVMLSWATAARWPVLAVGAALLVVVAFGQLALGVHYPSDIVAGWLLAGAWTALVWSIRSTPPPSDPPPRRGSPRWSRS